METKRDNVIDEKVMDLKSKKAEIEKRLAELPPFKTNLIVKNGAEHINLRAVNSLDKVFDAYRAIEASNNCINKFKDEIIQGKCDYDRLIDGYTYEQWISDLKIIVTKMIDTETLNKINSCIANIEKFYSGDRKEENAFNDLLQKINSI